MSSALRLSANSRALRKIPVASSSVAPWRTFSRDYARSALKSCRTLGKETPLLRASVRTFLHCLAAVRRSPAFKVELSTNSGSTGNVKFSSETGRSRPSPETRLRCPWPNRRSPLASQEVRPNSQERLSRRGTLLVHLS